MLSAPKFSYKRREPETTDLHRLVRSHFPSIAGMLRERFGPHAKLAKFQVDAVERYVQPNAGGQRRDRPAVFRRRRHVGALRRGRERAGGLAKAGRGWTGLSEGVKTPWFCRLTPVAEGAI